MNRESYHASEDIEVKKVFIGNYFKSAILNPNDNVNSFKNFCDTYLNKCIEGSKDGQYFTTASNVELTLDNKEIQYPHFHRNNATHSKSFCVCIDGDSSKDNKKSCIDPDIVHSSLMYLNLNHAIYTSHSHNPPDILKWRAVVKCLVSNPEEHRNTVLWLHSLLYNHGCKDLVIKNESLTLSQMWYTPRSIDISRFRYYEYHGGYDLKAFNELPPDLHLIPKDKGITIPGTSNKKLSLKDMEVIIENGESPLHDTMILYMNVYADKGKTIDEIIHKVKERTEKWNMNDARLSLYYNDIGRCAKDAFKHVAEEKEKDKNLHNLIPTNTLQYIEQEPDIITIDELIKEHKNIESYQLMSDYLLNPGGMLQEFMKMYECSAMYHYPEMSLMSSFVIVGSIFGQRIKTATDLRSNMYLIVLAEPGDGKENLFTPSQNFLKPIRDSLESDTISGGWIRNIAGPTRLASEAALMSSLNENNVTLQSIDECSSILTNTKNKNSSLFGLSNTFTELYTKTDTYFEKAYADIKKKITVNLPHVSFMGATVPRRFNECITIDDIDSGFMPRCVLLNINRDVNRKGKGTPDFKMLRKEIINLNKSLGLIHNKPKRIKENEDISNYRNTIDDRLKKRYARGTIERAISRRMIEHEAKYTMLHAVSEGRKKVTLDDFEYGYKLAYHNMLNMIHIMNSNTGENKFDRTIKTYVEKIKIQAVKMKRNYITGEELTNVVLRRVKYKKYEKQDIMYALLDGLVKHKLELNPKTKRYVNRYYIVK